MFFFIFINIFKIQIITNINTQINSINENNILILDCFFINMNHCCIILTNSNTNISIISCLFNECKTDLIEGVAIRLYSNSILLFLSKVCGSNCYSTSSNYLLGQFCYFLLNSNINNSIEYLSLQYCSPYSNINRNSCLFFRDGLFNIKNLNSSKNYPSRNSAILFHYGSKGYVCNSNIINNLAREYCTIQSTGNSASNYLNLNVINNSQDTSSRGVIYAFSSNIQFEKSIFINNYLMLFYKDSNSLKVSNSYIIGSYNQYNSNIQNCFNLITSTFNLIHFNTFFCNAINPLNIKTIPKLTNIYFQNLLLLHISIIFLI